MYVRIEGVQKGDAIVQPLKANAFVMTDAPEDGLIFTDDYGHRIYVRLSDIDEALMDFGPGLRLAVDPWRDNEESSSEDVSAVEK